jgi:ATP-dependent exoDNAse (exonuclease V) beta subunit
MGVTAAVADGEASGGGRGSGGPNQGLVGTLVHRLFAANAARVAPGLLALDALAHRLLAPEERAAVADTGALVADACRCYAALASRQEVTSLLGTARCLYEVPFSLLDEDGTGRGILRGSIDCLALMPAGRAVVMEIKTGGAQPWHQRQLEVYVRAARRLLPGVVVEGLLVYPESSP